MLVNNSFVFIPCLKLCRPDIVLGAASKITHKKIFCIPVAICLVKDLKGL